MRARGIQRGARANPGTFCVVMGQLSREAKPEFEMDAHDNPASILPVNAGSVP